ncbi:hypothetical protein EON65_28010 [archaeon]|nr:MAG: hypothetical protein EON65_28010 [archaeon]
MLIALSLTSLCTALGILLMTVSLPSSPNHYNPDSASGGAHSDFYTEDLPLVFGYMDRWHFSYQSKCDSMIVCISLCTVLL